MSDPTRHIPRALSFADVVDSPSRLPDPPRHKTPGIPCGCCGARVFHARVNRGTVPVCDDCRREADLSGRMICRDAEHIGERSVGYRSLARQWRDPMLDICLKCQRRRHPGRKVVALDDHPARDHNHKAGRLEPFVLGSRLVADWIRRG
jgi:hypothetical protein